MTKEKKSESDVQKKRPEVIIGALIINPENKFLLAKNVRWNGKYVVFGGHVEFSETLENAVRREIQEEVNIELESVTKIGFDEYVPKENEESEHYTAKHLVFLDYLCAYNGPDSDIDLCDEYEKDSQIWVTLDEALRLDLGGGTRGMFQRYEEYMKQVGYLNYLKRLQADFENYKKRQAESQKELAGYLIEKLLFDIIPVLDNFKMATGHVPEDAKDSPWVTGIQYIEKQLEDALKSHGVEVMEVREGDAFDPTKMEAIDSQQSADNSKQEAKENGDKPKQEVVGKVLQNGYRIGERVVRAAKVTVKNA
jgi:molecular chaperone GrpE